MKMAPNSSDITGYNAELRNKLFSIYSENLSLYSPELQDKFRCPICQNIFSSEDFQPDKSAIALAHVVPKSIGGKLKTLACSRCDNEVGRKYDIHLARYKKKFDKKKRNDTKAYGYFRPKVGDGINVMVDFAGMTSYEPHLDFFNPPQMPLNVWRDYWENYITQLDTQKGEFRFSLAFKESPFKSKNLYISLIYSAFLMMFYQFGYEYILSKNADYIQQAIFEKDTSINFEKAILFGKLPTADERFPLPTFAVTRISEDAVFMSSFVPLDEEFGYIVQLPGFGSGDLDSYCNLLNGAYDDTSRLDIMMVPRDICPHLFNTPGLTGIGRELYKRITGLPLEGDRI